MSRKARPQNQVLGHSDEADGIEEYDNPLPDWWLGLFWITIVWALGYTLHYHYVAERSQEKALAAEIAAAEVKWPQAAAQSDVTFAPTAELAAAGRSVYDTNCTACHGAAMEGGIGPNLVDAEWIHGAAPDSVLMTITVGVAAKGMPAWGPILGPERVRQVASYILTQQEQ